MPRGEHLMDKFALQNAADVASDDPEVIEESARLGRMLAEWDWDFMYLDHTERCPSCGCKAYDVSTTALKDDPTAYGMKHHCADVYRPTACSPVGSSQSFVKHPPALLGYCHACDRYYRSDTTPPVETLGMEHSIPTNHHGDHTDSLAAFYFREQQ